MSAVFITFGSSGVFSSKLSGFAPRMNSPSVL